MAAARPVLGAVAATTAGVLPVFLTGALSVQLGADLGFGPGGLGFAVAAFFGAAALVSARAGRLGERLGAERALRAAAAGSAGVQLAIALAARGSVWPLAGLLAGGGLANAVAQPSANLLLARAVAPQRRGLAFGIKQAAIPTATLLGGVAVPVIALTVGWRWAYAGGALLALGAAALVPSPVAGRAGARARPRAVADPPLLLLAAGIALGAAAANSLGTFTVASAVRAGYGEGAAGLLFAGGSAVGLLVRLAAGAGADRRDGPVLPVVAAMLAVGASGMVLLGTGSQVWVAVGVALAFGLGWGWPGLFNLGVVRRHPDDAGAATGVTQTGTYVGALVGPLAFGAVSELASVTVAWATVGAWALGAAALVLAGERAGRRSVRWPAWTRPAGSRRWSPTRPARSPSTSRWR